MKVLLALATCCCALANTSNVPCLTSDLLPIVMCHAKKPASPSGWALHTYRFSGEEVEVLLPCKPQMSSSQGESQLFCADADSGSFFMITVTPHGYGFINQLEDPNAFIADLEEGLERHHQLISCDVWKQEGASIAEIVISVAPGIYLKMRVYVTAYNTFTLCTIDTTVRHTEATSRFLNSFRVSNITSL